MPPRTRRWKFTGDIREVIFFYLPINSDTKTITFVVVAIFPPTCHFLPLVFLSLLSLLVVALAGDDDDSDADAIDNIFLQSHTEKMFVAFVPLLYFMFMLSEPSDNLLSLSNSTMWY